MIHSKQILTVALLATSALAGAQTLATDHKGAGNNNPISVNIFCADPTALEYGGRLYVYGSNDHQQFIANGKKGENTYGDIKSLVVFSTDDMVNWTFHGTIDVAKLCASWTPSKWYRGFHASWAPSVVWRTNKRTHKDEFFLYYCSSSHGVGVLRASSPVGPWSSPLDELLIHRDTPGATPCSAIFDPGVTIDEEGTAWLSFGGLDPVDGGNSLDPRNARIVKLTSSMVKLDGDITLIPAPYHFEANELNVIGGKYVYTYCSNWAERTAADWNAYKAEKGISVSAPGKCTMCYMTTDTPQDPDSWEYRGVYGPHPGMGTGNNHSHLQQFQGNYYYIYHGASLMQNWQNANVIDKDCKVFRSICVNPVTVNEQTATISAATPNLSGVTAIKNLDPYELQQAETMASSGGVDYEDYTNIMPNTTSSTLGNDASENMQVQLRTGSWINVRSVDFGTIGACRFTLRAKGTGTVEIRLGRKGATASATIECSSTQLENHSVTLDATRFQGVKDVYFVVTAASDFQVDAWQFEASDLSGIQEVGAEASSRQPAFSYDLSGRRLPAAHRRGIVIHRNTKRVQ